MFDITLSFSLIKIADFEISGFWDLRRNCASATKSQNPKIKNPEIQKGISFIIFSRNKIAFIIFSA